MHSDRREPIEHGSLQQPIHATVAYGYERAEDLAAVFQGKQPGYTYGRQVNPTVEALQRKISAMEGGLSTLCFGTGMAAIGTTLFTLLRSGDHMVASQFLFGNTNSLFRSFEQQGIGVSFVDATSLDAVAEALTDQTRLVFVETIANPRTQIAALAELGELCRQRGLVYVVDNTMTSPFLFQPRDVGASLVVNSLTKYIGGHGNALGGAVTETGCFAWDQYPNIDPLYRKGDPTGYGMTQIKKKGLRDFGAALGPEAAHHLGIGAETLALRMTRQCDTAQRLTAMLAEHPKVARVYYPGRPDHPQHERAATLFGGFGALFSFELEPDCDIWRFMASLNVIVKSSNLGDNRTLIIPVAHTIFHEVGPERRAAMGIVDSLMRVSVGIEDPEDLQLDLERALEAA